MPLKPTEIFVVQFIVMRKVVEKNLRQNKLTVMRYLGEKYFLEICVSFLWNIMFPYKRRSIRNLKIYALKWPCKSELTY